MPKLGTPEYDAYFYRIREIHAPIHTAAAAEIDALLAELKAAKASRSR